MRLHMHRHRRRFLLKSGAIAAALVFFVLSPLAEIVHLCVVPHGICPLDGELIELSGNRTPTQAISAAPAVESHHDQRETGHPHHHCEVAANRTLPSVGQSPALEPWLPEQMAEANIVLPADFPIRLIALLRLAPKASPPA